MKKRFPYFILFFLIFPHSSFGAASSIKIALLAGFTGVANIPSYHLLHTAEMKIKDINQNGGIHGKHVELIIMDDESNPVNTLRLANDPRLDNVVGIIGFPWSQFIMVAAPILQKRKIPSISILATHDKIGNLGDYIYTVCFDNTYQGKLLAKYAVKTAKVTKAIMFVNLQNTYSVDLSKAIRGEFERLGGQITRSISYIPQKSIEFFSGELKKIIPDAYEAVFLPDDQVYVMPIMESFYRLGIENKKYFGGDGWNMATLHMKTQHYNKFEMYVVGHWNNDVSLKRNRDFIENFEKTFPSQAQDATALSSDAIDILISAIQKTPSLDKDLINVQLRNSTFNGLTGKIRFRKSNKPDHKPIVIHKITNGKRSAVAFQ